MEFQDLSTVFKPFLFSGLSEDERNAVLEHIEIVKYKKGDILFSPGEKAEHIYFLQKGQVRILRPSEDGSEDEIALFAHNDVIGDFDFARGADYDVRAVAVEDSSIVVFPACGINMGDLALEMPQTISKILLNSASIVISRIKETRNLVIDRVSWVNELQRQVHEDPGTGLWKQSFLNEDINRILESPSALIMLKPDRFKILVDSLGHEAGDVGMVKIAAILKDITRMHGRGWAMRFRSNETGILIPGCDEVLGESIANSLYSEIAGIPPVPLSPSGRMSEGKTTEGETDVLKIYEFSGTVAWGIWPQDEYTWEVFFGGVYDLLMESWREGGNRTVRYVQNKGHIK